MEENWIDLLSSPDTNNGFKVLINTFFIPDNILVNDFFTNSVVLRGGAESYSAKNHATKSFKQIHRTYPPFYPNWFIAAYPDVVNWVINNHEESNVFGTLTEKLIISMESNTQLQNDFFRKLINEFLKKVSNILECTEADKKNYEKEILEYPKRDIDNLGRIIKETILKDGYEITSIFQYNRLNQIVRIDKLGNDVYGEWESKPSEIFEFDDNGMINKHVKYDISEGIANPEVLSSKMFYNEYDSNNRLIGTHGQYKTPMYKSFHYDICLRLNYVEEEKVEILFDHEFFDNDYNSNKEKINQLYIKRDNEESRAIKDRLFNEISQLRNNQKACREQEIVNMQQNRFYKKDTDSNYTLILKITTDKLIQTLNSYTGINQFKNKNE